MKVKIQYRTNGRIEPDELRTGTISNYGLSLKTIWIMMDRYFFKNVL